MAHKPLTAPAGQYAIRRMDKEDVGLAMEWAAQEGWNPGLTDGDCFYVTDPEGFFIGELSGVPVGCISAVAYDDTFGFIGLYIVRPEYRGKGYGIRLWNAAMEYLGTATSALTACSPSRGIMKGRASGWPIKTLNLRVSSGER